MVSRQVVWWKGEVGSVIGGGDEIGNRGWGGTASRVLGGGDRSPADTCHHGDIYHFVQSHISNS